MLSPTAAKLGSRPVTRDGITIPPPLPMLLPHDVVVSGSETGSGGNADPCNISNQPTPVTFDGQKDTKLGTPSRTGTPEVSLRMVVYVYMACELLLTMEFT